MSPFPSAQMTLDPTRCPPMAGSELPSWAKSFADAVFACLNEIEGTTTGFDCRYNPPDTQIHDDHLLLLAPQPLEISGGKDDGEIVCDPLSVDIDSVQQLFTALESTTYHAAKGEDWYLRRRLELSGHVGDRSISVYIFDEPFDDAEVRTVLDESTNSFRPKRPL